MTETSPADPSAVNKIFGTEIPQESPDERDVDGIHDERDREHWLRDNVPPHHM